MGEMEDKDRTELFSRRIAEDVSKSVEASLRRRYSWIGLITAFILGGLGYGLITAVVRDASDSVSRSQILLDNVEKQLVKVDKRTGDKLAELDQFVHTSETRLKTLDDQIESTAKSVETHMQTVDALLSSRQRDLENLGSTAQRIEDLTAQVADLNKVVAQMARGMEASGPSDTQPAEYTAALSRQTGQIAELREQTKDVVQRIKTSRISVYVHFPQAKDYPAGRAENVAQQLESLGYSVPDIRRVANVRSLNQVRFYYEEDRAAAEQLALDTSQALKELGNEEVAVEARDLTGWKELKPPRGVVELWL